MFKSRHILFLFHFVLLSSELCNITYAWESSYGLGSAAVSKINNAVRGGGGGGSGVEQLKETDQECMPPSGPPEVQEEKMGLERKMGFWDMVDSAVSGVIIPNTYAWKSSYGLGPDAVSKINNAVRGGGNGVEQLKETDHEYMPPSGPPEVQEEKMGGEREMGFLNVLDSAVSGVKTPVSNALRSSYSLGSAAVSKINNAVRGGGGNGVEQLKDTDHEYMPPSGPPEVQEEKLDLERKMGFRDVVDSAVSGVKSPITYAWESSYSLGSAAVSKINKDAVLNGVEKLKEYMPGPEGQEIIGQALTLVIPTAAKELLKLVAPPGRRAQAYNLVAAVARNRVNHPKKKRNRVNHPKKKRNRVKYRPCTSANYSLHESKKYEQVMEQLKVQITDENERQLKVLRDEIERQLKVLRDENKRMRADLEHIKEFKLNSTTTTSVRVKSSSTAEQELEEDRGRINN